MTRKNHLHVLAMACFSAMALIACGSEETTARSGDDFRVLVFSQTTGFRHVSIETGVDTVRQLGSMHGFSVDHSEEPTDFNDDNLARYAAVIWLSTTGNLLDEEQRQAFERYIQSGGGYVGIHSASDSNYDWAFYGELVGAYFHSHPVFPVNADEGPGVQAGELHVEADDHLSTTHLPAPWAISDEFYSFRENPRGQVRVLLNIDEQTYNQDPNTSNISEGSFIVGETGVMNDHPMSWCHDRLGGRAWYTALGHSVSLYEDTNFRLHLLGGILTAAGRQDADCEPREDGPLAEADSGIALPPIGALPIEL